MRAILKIFAVTIGVVFAIGFGALIYLDDAQKRAFAITAFESWTGAEFQVDGELSVSVYPSLSVMAGTVGFVLPHRGVSGNLRRFQLSVDLLSAIFGPLKIERLIAEDGSIRIVGGVKPKLADEDAATRVTTLPIVQQVEIIDVRLDATRVPLDKHVTVDIERLSTQLVSASRKLMITGKGAFNGEPFEWNGAFGPPDETAAGKLDVPVHLALVSNGIQSTASGQMTDLLQDARLDVAVTVNASSGSVLDQLLGSLTPQNARLDLSGRVRGPIARPEIQDLRVDVTGDGVFLEAKGTIGDLVRGAGISLSFAGSVEQQYLQSNVPGPIQALGLERIQAKGHMLGSLEQIAFSELDLIANLGEQARLLATGRFALADTLVGYKVSSADLAIRLNAPTTQWISTAISASLPPLGAVEGRANLVGHDGELAFEAIDIHVGKGRPVALRLTGRLPRLAGKIADQLEAAELHGEILATDTMHLAPLLGTDLPSLGPFRMRAAIIPYSGAVDLDKAEIDIGRAGNLVIHLTGGARVVGMKDGTTIEKIDAVVNIISPASVPLTRLFKLEAPEFGSITATASLTGNASTLSVRSIDLRVGENTDLQIAARGSIGQIDLSGGKQFRKVDIAVEATAQSVASITRRIKIELPELGLVRATARLRDKNDANRIDAETLEIIVGDVKRPKLSIAGRFDDILNPQLGVMKAIARAESVPLLKAIGLTSVIDLGPLKADFQLAARDGRLGLKSLSISAESREKVSVTAHGVIDDVLKLDGIELDVALSAPDASVFHPVLHGVLRPAGSTHIDAKVVFRKPVMKFEGNLQLGDSNIDVALVGSIANQRPKLSGKIAAKRLELTDIGISTRGTLTKKPPGNDGTPDQQRYIFFNDPLPFEHFFGIDLDFDLQAGEVRGLEYPFQSLNVQLRLIDGRLTVAPARLTYAEGSVDLSGTVDATTDPPSIRLRLRGDDFRLRELLLLFNSDPGLNGELSIDAELQSRGNSLRDLAANMSGTLGLALEKGRIDGVNLHVLSNDTLQYLFSLPNLSEHTDLRCAIARFDIEAGIARSQALLIATPRMTISGNGLIDLGAEKLEFAIAADRDAFVPVGFKKPVRIHGTLSDPKVSTTAADTGLFRDLFGKLTGYVAAPFVFAPLSATGSLIDILREPGTKSPCLAG